jgi:hypothetical protein
VCELCYKSTAEWTTVLQKYVVKAPNGFFRMVPPWSALTAGAPARQDGDVPLHSKLHLDSINQVLEPLTFKVNIPPIAADRNRCAELAGGYHRVRFLVALQSVVFDPKQDVLGLTLMFSSERSINRSLCGCRRWWRLILLSCPLRQTG